MIKLMSLRGGWVILLAALLPLFPGLRAGEPATIQNSGTVWTLANQSMEARVEFSHGGIALTNLKNVRTGEDLLTGAGERYLFRHVVDEMVWKSDDGGWMLTGSSIGSIEVRGKQWGRELKIDMANTNARLSLTLVFEIYDGTAGLRYHTLIKNDDVTQERTISASDVIALNFPDRPHTISYVPWQTAWQRIDGGISNGKRQCLTRYADSNSGWALLPENNWCTALRKAGFPGAGDPNHPFLFLNAWGDGSNNVTVKTDPVAVKLVLFPGERVTFFSVNLVLFQGDEWDARFAVAQHFRKRFKYTNPQPQLDFQEYQVEFLQTDANARNLLIPALSDAGFDRWEVTWKWNGGEGDDSVEPRPGFTRDLKALSEFCLSKGVRIGYYNTMSGGYWGEGRDLADPAAIAFKRKQIDESTIRKYHSTWQMIDLGEFWWNDKETACSHPSDNVYRKALAVREYMTDMTRRHPDWVPLTTCELEAPGVNPRAQCVDLMLIAENGQAGSYCRTDNASGARPQSPRSNLSDAFNFIGLMPLEAYVGVYGESGTDPWPDMFTPACYYSTLLSGCSTFYSDVRRWTPAQKQHMRQFNDWRKNPRISAMLGEVARPVHDGPDHNNRGPYAWMYVDTQQTTALLIAVGFGIAQELQPRLRGLNPDRTYWVEDITLGREKPGYVFRGRHTGRDLMANGLPLDLAAHGASSLACWIQAEKPQPAQVLYADANVEQLEETPVAGRLAVKLGGRPNTTARLVIAKPGKDGVEDCDIPIDASGHASVTLDPDKVSQVAQPLVMHPPATVKPEPPVLGGGGDWVGRFGKTAAWLAGAGDLKMEQNGFRMDTDAGVHIWAVNANASDDRVLLSSNQTAAVRRAACWTAAERINLCVWAPDAKPYRLSVYLLDYDRCGRTHQVALHGANGTLLDTQIAEATATAKGVYLSWTVTGSVELEVTKTTGLNAAASAVFVDPG